MSEVFIAFMLLSLITTIQFTIVVNRLAWIEQKINALKAESEGEDENE